MSSRWRLEGFHKNVAYPQVQAPCVQEVTSFAFHLPLTLHSLLSIVCPLQVSHLLLLNAPCLFHFSVPLTLLSFLPRWPFLPLAQHTPTVWCHVTPLVSASSATRELGPSCASYRTVSSSLCLSLLLKWSSKGPRLKQN